MHSNHPMLSRRAFIGAQALLLASLVGCGPADEASQADDAPASPRSLDEIAGSGFVRVGITSDDRPLGYISMRGNYAGYDHYFSLFLATRLGVGEVRCVAIDPKERYEALLANKVDVLLVGASPDDEAGEGVAYVRPPYAQRLCVVSPEAAVVDAADKLSGGELIVCEGTYAARYAERTWPDVALRRYETHTDTWRALEDGRGIGVLTDEVSGLSWVSGAEEPFVCGMLGIGDEHAVCPAIAAGQDDLYNAVDQAVKAFHKNEYGQKAYTDYIEKYVDSAEGVTFEVPEP